MADITIEDVANITTLTAGPDRAAAWRAIDALAMRLYDHRLLTVLRHIVETSEVERLYSSHPTAYPAGGRKQKAGTDWGRQVLDRGEVFICHTKADIERTFNDHSLIFSLGVGGMVNVPIRLGGKCVATMNISTTGDRFGDTDHEQLLLLGALVLPLVLSA
jgi:hypothetical protein